MFVKLSHRRSEALSGYLFIAPIYIGFLIFIAAPIVVAFGLSFTKFDILKGATFIGLNNYTHMLTDARLQTVYRNTALFTSISVVLNVGIGLLLAVALNSRLPRLIRNFYRSIFFFPVLIAHTYISVIWQFLYAKDTGIFNYYLSQIGVGPIPWLNSSQWVLFSIILMDVWKNTGFAMLLFLAGLQNIPGEYYEVAQIDGANGVNAFFKITLPLLSPTIFFILVIFMTGALQVFDSIMVISEGGPGDASRSIVMYIYEKAFRTFDMGYASAVAMTLFVLILGLTLLQFALGRRWVHYE